MEFKEKLISSHLLLKKTCIKMTVSLKQEHLHLRFLKRKAFLLKKRRHGNILHWRL